MDVGIFISEVGVSLQQVAPDSNVKAVQRAELDAFPGTLFHMHGVVRIFIPAAPGDYHTLKMLARGHFIPESGLVTFGRPITDPVIIQHAMDGY